MAQREICMLVRILWEAKNYCHYSYVSIMPTKCLNEILKLASLIHHLETAESFDFISSSTPNNHLQSASNISGCLFLTAFLIVIGEAVNQWQPASAIAFRIVLKNKIIVIQVRLCWSASCVALEMQKEEYSNDVADASRFVCSRLIHVCFMDWYLLSKFQLKIQIMDHLWVFWHYWVIVLD